MFALIGQVHFSPFPVGGSACQVGDLTESFVAQLSFHLLGVGYDFFDKVTQ